MGPEYDYSVAVFARKKKVQRTQLFYHDEKLTGSVSHWKTQQTVMYCINVLY